MKFKILKNKKAITILLISILILASCSIVYAIYRNEINVTYKATTGEMVCDIEIEKNESYKINGIPYFLVKVRNYETDESGRKKLTAVDLEYNLTIKNKTGSNGIFIWQKEDKSAGINTYLETITTDTCSFEKTEKEDVYKVFVKTSNDSVPENVEIDVELNAVQKSAN